MVKDIIFLDQDYEQQQAAKPHLQSSEILSLQWAGKMVTGQPGQA